MQFDSNHPVDYPSLKLCAAMYCANFLSHISPAMVFQLAEYLTTMFAFIMTSVRFWKWCKNIFSKKQKTNNNETPK